MLRSITYTHISQETFISPHAVLTQFCFFLMINFHRSQTLSFYLLSFLTIFSKAFWIYYIPLVHSITFAIEGLSLQYLQVLFNLTLGLFLVAS